MHLRRGELHVLTGAPDVAAREPWALDHTKRVGIIADAVSDAACAAAPVAEVERNDVGGLSGLHPCGPCELAAAAFDFDLVAGCDAEPPRKRRADRDDIFPR